MSHLTLLGLLFFTGAVWGLTIPVTKIAVSTGYQPLGLIFWQLLISIVALGGLTLIKGRSLGLSFARLRFFAVIGLLGTIVPNGFSYTAAAQLPAGIMAIMIAMVPMFSLPIAAMAGLERLQAHRVMGVLLGAIAVVLIVAPSTSLPEPGQAFYVLLALIPPICYGLEGNYIAWRGTSGLDPVQVLFGASLVALVLVTPMAVYSGQFIDLRIAWGASEIAILGIGLLHAVAYSLYIWLVGKAGAVFSSQVSYLVTGTGVAWSILILSESYSNWVWAALAIMLAGLALVQPRQVEQTT